MRHDPEDLSPTNASQSQEKIPQEVNDNTSRKVIVLRVVIVAVGTVVGIAGILAFDAWREWKQLGFYPAMSGTPSPENFFPLPIGSEQPVVTGFKIKRASEVTDAINQDELVIGVTIDGESRAFPLNMLTGPSREIVNDELGGQPIAATW